MESIIITAIITAIIVGGIVGLAWVALHFGYKAYLQEKLDKAKADRSIELHVNAKPAAYQSPELIDEMARLRRDGRLTWP